MIEVPVPKDVTKYKATLIGPLTARMTVCVCITAVVEFILFKLLLLFKVSLSVEALVSIGVFVAVPIMAFSFIEPFEMPLEKFLKNVLALGYLAPKVRPYVTVNVLDPEPKQKDEKKSKKREFTSKELKMHPDYVMYE